MIEKSINSIAGQLPETIDKVQLNYSSGEGYVMFQNRVISYLEEKKLLVDKNVDENSYRLNYTVENIDVNYSEAFKNGWFGEYKVERNVLLNISYSLNNNGNVIQSNFFEETITDTINYSDIESVESYGIKFTQSEKPTEPFFQSFLEPVIAVGTLIVSIILLFTVRSK